MNFLRWIREEILDLGLGAWAEIQPLCRRKNLSVITIDISGSVYYTTIDIKIEKALMTTGH